ncbi:hypothetical protein LXD69_16885 [Flavobacterium sediminilitoris]|uniref:Uncharacterized protein n=1 Tax=Flavobacterium sediminilitoris TaxID=2024526 RepID=A0ABY4HM07_9FLAO|nr:MULTISPECIES: hypothetical protein [Flavobacterium]UOX33696.1 hypothetical protein LXD69_16885 [Flavobacterium sediminilitoris]
MEEIHQKIASKIKKIVVFLFILSFKSSLFSQSFESIKRSDTIYIYFDKDKKNSSREKAITTEKSEFYENYLTYKFDPDPTNTILFISNKYKNRDNIKKGIKNDERIERKSFLKKNKNIILDIDFFTKNGFLETYLVIYKKIIYLIDKEEIKGRKIKVKQVEMMNFTYNEM